MAHGPARTVLLAAFSLLALLGPRAGLRLAAQESREANLDVILLVDKSLSMAKAEAGVKRYLAGEVIGPLLVAGDRLIIETFYGKVDRLYAGTIRSEADKAAIVRSLNAIVADGRFTDIGLALDRAKADLDELGAPERPKYVLLLTDERQEAPAGTKYFSPTYTLQHPALDYVKRDDKGGFHVITVGFDVGPRVEAATPGVMRFLKDLVARALDKFPDLPAGTDPGLAGAVAAGGAARGSAPAAARGLPPWALVAGGIVAVLILAAIALRVVQWRKSRRERQNDAEQGVS